MTSVGCKYRRGQILLRLTRLTTSALNICYICYLLTVFLMFLMSSVSGVHSMSVFQETTMSTLLDSDVDN